MNKVDCEPPDSRASLGEARRLREENIRLRSLLNTRGIRIPEPAQSTGESPHVSNSATGPGIQEWAGPSSGSPCSAVSSMGARMSCHSLGTRRPIWIHAQDGMRLEIVSTRQRRLQQYLGRLNRINDAKRVVRVYDNVDSNVPMLARM